MIPVKDITNINNHIVAIKTYANHDDMIELYNDLSHSDFYRYLNAIVNYNTHVNLKIGKIYVLLTNALIESDVHVIDAIHQHDYTKYIFKPILPKQELWLRYAGNNDLVYTVYENHKLCRHQVLHIHQRKLIEHE